MLAQAMAAGRFQRHPDNFRRLCIISFTAHLGLIVAAVTLPAAIRPKSTPLVVSLVDLPGGGVKAAAKRSSPPPLKAPQAPPAEQPPAAEPAKPKLTYPEKTKPVKKPELPKKTATSQVGVEKSKGTAAAAGKLESKFEGREFSTGVGMNGLGGGSLEGFPFAYYLLRIRDKISSNWFQSIVVGSVTGQFRVAVFFQIQRDGRLTNVQVEESSGISSLDLSAQRAVYASNPMPPLPQGYGEDTLNVHFMFYYER